MDRSMASGSAAAGGAGSGHAVHRDAWLRGYHAGEPGAPRLLCLPHAGGSASFYFPLSRRLAPGAEMLAVQYPGRQDRHREPPIADIGDLADRIVAALPAGGGRPLALFGHSMGAVVAFEVARRLAAGPAGPPAVLIVSGRRAPSRQVAEMVHQLDDAGVLGELKKLSGTDARVLGDEELLRMILPAIRADYRALARYVAAWDAAPDEAGVSCPIVALTGDRDPVAPVADVLAWAGHTTGPFESKVFPGGHFYLADQQEEVTRTIRDALKTYA